MDVDLISLIVLSSMIGIFFFIVITFLLCHKHRNYVQLKS